MSGEGGPLAARGHMPFAGHRNVAGEAWCRECKEFRTIPCQYALCPLQAAAGGGAMTRSSVVAAYRPRENDIALFVENGEGHSAVSLELEEARKIHGALGQALKLADCRENPISALPDHRPVKGAPV